MEIRGITWIDDVVDKLEWKHSVRQYEVEEVLYRHPSFRFVERGERSGEDVYVALGRADSGRLLAVFFIHKQDGKALIISARNMSRAERRRHERR